MTSVFDGASDAPTTYWGAPSESEHTRRMSNQQMLDYQRKTMDDQDRILDVISQTLDRTKEVAVDIGSEVDEQNVLLDDIDNDVTRVNRRVKDATKRVRDVTRKSGSCFLWMVIAFLFLVLLAVIALAFFL